MGKHRPTPSRLAEKLLRIRQTLGVSQNGMIERLGLTGDLSREKISAYERAQRVPSLHVLLRYARAAGVWMDVLIDDDLDLPRKLPASTKHAGIPREKTTPRRR